MVTNRQYQYGTSPRKLEPIQKQSNSLKTTTKKKQTKKNNKKAKQQAEAKRKLKLFLSLGIVFALMFAICYRYSLIDQKFKDIQTMKKEYIALQTTNDQLEIGIQSSLDLTNIERHAKDKLGMKKADSTQIKYVEIAKEDKVELSENIVQEENVFQKFFENITKLLD